MLMALVIMGSAGNFLNACAMAAVVVPGVEHHAGAFLHHLCRCRGDPMLFLGVQLPFLLQRRIEESA